MENIELLGESEKKKQKESKVSERMAHYSLVNACFVAAKASKRRLQIRLIATPRIAGWNGESLKGNLNINDRIGEAMVWWCPRVCVKRKTFLKRLYQIPGRARAGEGDSVDRRVIEEELRLRLLIPTPTRGGTPIRTA